MINIRRWDKLNKEVAGTVEIQVDQIENVRGKHFMLKKERVKGKILSHEGSVITIKGQGECLCADPESVVREKMDQAFVEPVAFVEPEDQPEPPSPL